MAKCEFFYDFSSPFSYLAATQIERVTTGHELVWKPILLGGLLKSIGSPIVPIATFSPAKARLYMIDQYRFADHWGVEFRFPRLFPQRTMTALRAALVVPKEKIAAVSKDLFRVMWVEDGNLEEPEAVARVLSRHGLDAAAILKRTEEPEIKEQLRKNTDEAMTKGVFGVPTFVIGDMLIWGQDRLEFVEKALKGWVPKGELEARAMTLPRIE